MPNRAGCDLEADGMVQCSTTWTQFIYLPHLPFWSLADANNPAFRAGAGSESVRLMHALPRRIACLCACVC